MDVMFAILGVLVLFLIGVVWWVARLAHATRVEAEAVRHALASALAELNDARAEVKSLSGLLPLCAWCKKIRDDAGYWQQLEGYISTHTGAEFSHSMCPDCFNRVQADMPDAHWRI